MRSLRFRDFLAISLVLSAAGCTGGDDGREPTHPVSGKITLNGQPVEGAVVSFSPTGKQRVATGRTDAEGKYTLWTHESGSGDGAMAGEYIVLVSKPVPASTSAAAGHGPDGKFEAPKHSGKAETKSELPEKYGRPDQSGLKVTVPADDAEAYNFDLKP